LRVAVVFPAERDLVILESQQALIGYGYTMGIASQVLDDLLGSAKRRLGVHHPLALAQGTQVAGQSGRIAQRLQFSEELQLAGGVRPRGGDPPPTEDGAARHTAKRFSSFAFVLKINCQVVEKPLILPASLSSFRPIR
jgi:hypothetical protein